MDKIERIKSEHKDVIRNHYALEEKHNKIMLKVFDTIIEKLAYGIENNFTYIEVKTDLPLYDPFTIDIIKNHFKVEIFYKEMIGGYSMKYYQVYL